MGNSTLSVQNVVEEVAVIGNLTPVLKNVGGYAAQPALNIASKVMSEMIARRFPWKWNRKNLYPFVLNPLQQDYATINLQGLGWLEYGIRIDINNTQVPPPSWPLEVVRDNPMDNIMGGFPFQVNSLYNKDLEQGRWPGPEEVYGDPIGASVNPDNPLTNIRDENDNILVLTQYGTTGETAPKAVVDPDNPDADLTGQQVPDGSCIWTVANPNAQGFRILPRPPQGGNVWLIRLFGQAKAPPRFTKLSQLINPIPDDYSNWFIDGFIAYCHKYSSDPNVQNRFDQKHNGWLLSMDEACKQGDREDESRGFYPDRAIAAPSFVQDSGPYPYRWGVS